MQKEYQIGFIESSITYNNLHQKDGKKRKSIVDSSIDQS
ncbi:unnamed protein product [Paramecium sonneborni]|uniref:Uncharacterized protein n=1 Tax=Paramecium sonneborni TaxID=65129 RepID=A0A8S1P6R7_9CILI|nr:unnamed protein product [Paramecium sonneborni]